MRYLCLLAALAAFAASGGHVVWGDYLPAGTDHLVWGD